MAGESAPLEVTLNYSAPEVIRRFHEETGVSLEDCNVLFQETKRWLWACARRDTDARKGFAVPDKLIISPELGPIDRMWHCFLLFTRHYHDFCSEHFGHFIHHDPLTSEEISQFEKLKNSDPRQALKVRRDELRPQLNYLHDLLGPQILKLWYQEFPKRFTFPT